MARCSRCGAEVSADTRYCGDCGYDTRAAVAEKTAVQPAVSQEAAPQRVAYSPRGGARASGGGSDATARLATGLGIGGGLLGILWGALGPYLSLKVSSIRWFTAHDLIHQPDYPYLVGMNSTVLLAIGVVLGALAILGAVLATRTIWVARILLPVCGLVGFLLGPSWLIPGAMMLAAGGLAIACKDGR